MIIIEINKRIVIVIFVIFIVSPFIVFPLFIELLGCIFL